MTVVTKLRVMAIAMGLFFVTSAANAQEWIKLAGTSDGYVIYIDQSSIRIKGDVYRVWTKEITPDGTMGNGANAAKALTDNRFFTEFNDADETYRIVEVLADYADGSVSTEPGPAGWHPVAPGSMASIELEFARSSKQK